MTQSGNPMPQQSAPPPPGGWAPPPQPVVGPAGLVYADVPNRAIAFVIDYVIFLVLALIVGIVIRPILGTNLGVLGSVDSTASYFVTQAISYALIAAYFIYMWTAQRATIGMRVLSLQVGNAADGRTITMNQAVTRWAAMFGPGVVVAVIASISLGLGLLASLVSFIWFCALIYTTAMSPTKQGLHDKYANTMVVKAARSVV
jgi:uncharacterized RDD family membrane protein YckC